MNRAEYNLKWASTVDHPSFVRVDKVDVPEDVQRLFEHEPCFRCGIARGPCRHRKQYA